MKRDPTDWSEADVEQCFAAPLGLTLEDLEQVGAPAPDYLADGKRHWTLKTMLAWQEAFFAAYLLSRPRELEETVATFTSLAPLSDKEARG